VGDNKNVEALHREAIALMRRIFDKPHDRLATALAGYARYLTGQERFDEAQAALDEALSIDRQVLGEQNARTAMSLDAMAMLDHARHDNAAAEHFSDDATRVLSALAKEAGFEEELIITRLHRADILLSLDRLDDASAQLDAIAKDVPRVFGEVSIDNADFIAANARVSLARHDALAAAASSERAMAIVAQIDLPSTGTKIALLRVHAGASALLGRSDVALADVSRALNLSQSANPNAHVQQTSLLLLDARLQSTAGNTAAASAAMAQARALNVPAALLSHEDASALNPNGV
jgi:tetratricopeptide (TPR) repeat protein